MAFRLKRPVGAYHDSTALVAGSKASPDVNLRSPRALRMRWSTNAVSTQPALYDEGSQSAVLSLRNGGQRMLRYRGPLSKTSGMRSFWRSIRQTRKRHFSMLTDKMRWITGMTRTFALPWRAFEKLQEARRALHDTGKLVRPVDPRDLDNWRGGDAIPDRKLVARPTLGFSSVKCPRTGQELSRFGDPSCGIMRTLGARSNRWSAVSRPA